MEFFERSSAVAFTEPEVPCEILERAVARARKYLVAEAALLAAIMEMDERRVYEKFGFMHLTPYCVRKLRLSEDVAACFVRVARKSVAQSLARRCRSEPSTSILNGAAVVPT